MKKLLLLYLLAIAFFMRPEDSFITLKGMYNDVKEDKKHLSPVHGFNWWKLGIIENMYRYGDGNDATIKLVHDLFYLQPDEVTFDVTMLERNPAKYFTPQTVGKILNEIEKYYSNQSQNRADQEKLAVSLKTVITVDISFKNLQQLSAQKLTDLEEKAQKLPQKKDLTQEKTSLKRQIERKPKKTTDLEAKKKETETKQQRLAVIEQELKKIEAIARQRHNLTISEKSIDELVDHMIGCLNEVDEHKYIPYALQQILLALAWKKGDTKKDFWDYFNQFEQKVLTATDEQEWITQVYTKERDYAAFEKNLEERNYAALLDDYELSSFGAYAAKVWGHPFPPIIGSIGDAMYIDQDGTKHYFSDCGETSLRNFFNSILYNQDKQLFDITLLQGSNDLIILPQLREYYQKYNKITQLQSKPYYNAWAQLVSDLPGVKYVNNGYEITGGLTSMLKVINHLLFGNSEEFTKKSNEQKLNLITNSLSRSNFDLTWEVKEGKREEVNTKNVINLEFYVNNALAFEWRFEGRHFVIPALSIELSESNLAIAQFLVEHIRPESNDALNLIGWYGTAALDNILETMLEQKNLKEVDYVFFIFTQNLSNNDQKTALLPSIVEKKVTVPIAIIGALLQSLPDDGRYWSFVNSLPVTYSSIIEKIIQEKVHVLAEIIGEKAEQFYNLLTPQLFDKIKNKEDFHLVLFEILRNKVEQFYYPITSKLLDNIKNRTTAIPQIFSAIVDEEIVQFYDLITPERLNKIYSRDSFGDEDEAIELIDSILTKKAEQFYYLITPEFFNKIVEPSGLSYIFSAIVNNKITEFYKFITPHYLNRIYDRENLNWGEGVNLIVAILDEKVEEFYYLVTPELLDRIQYEFDRYNIFKVMLKNKLAQFYKLITQAQLNKINDTTNLSDLIQMILEEELKQLYYLITPELLDTLPSADSETIFDIIERKKIKLFYPLVKRFQPTQHDVRNFRVYATDFVQAADALLATVEKIDNSLSMTTFLGKQKANDTDRQAYDQALLALGTTIDQLETLTTPTNKNLLNNQIPEPELRNIIETLSTTKEALSTRVTSSEQKTVTDIGLESPAQQRLARQADALDAIILDLQRL